MGQANKTRKNPREKYRVTNWSQYNNALIKRGSITIWLDADLKDSWFYAGDRKPGGKIEYSDMAIEFLMTIKQVYKLTYRSLQGFCQSIFQLSGMEGLKVPSYSQIQRRGKELKVNIQVRKGTKEALHVVIDSTGLKVFGEGEWKVRKHGWTKRRTWRKIHMASDGNDLEILSVILTGNDIDDSTAGVEAINSIEEGIKEVAADGAYDKKQFRNNLPPEVLQKIPLQKNAVISDAPGMEQRNSAIQSIMEIGREKWKERSGYHIRSKSEVNMYRFKVEFSEKLSSRKPETEKIEVELKSKILNKFVTLGMPKSRKIA